MTIIEKIKQEIELVETLRKLWSSLLPGAPVPSGQQMNIWLSKHTPENLIKAIRTTAKKYHSQNGAMNEDWLVRYTSSVVNNLTNPRITQTQTQEKA